MTHAGIALTFVFLTSAQSLIAQIIPNQSVFHARLLSPISTQTSKKGDKFTAQVMAPPQFSGDILEGVIRESKGGGKVKGKAILNFTFSTLNHGGQAIAVQASVTSLKNSRGQENVD